MSAVIPVIAAVAGGAGCGSWALLHRIRRPAGEPAVVLQQPTGVRVLGAEEVHDAALRAAASEMHLAKRIYERSLHFECLSSSGLGEPFLAGTGPADETEPASRAGSQA